MQASAAPIIKEEKKVEPIKDKLYDVDLEAQIKPLQAYKSIYFGEFSADEIIDLEKKYPRSAAQPQEFKTLKELDEEIDQHKILYYLKRGRYELARWSNFLYVIFQADTAQEGVPTFVHVFFPNLNVPPIVGKIIGYPSAVLDCLTYYWIFSSQKIATIATIDELHQPALRQRTATFFKNLCEQPKQTMSESLQFSFHEGLLLTCNISAIMTEIIDITDKLDSLPTPLKWLSIITILRYGVDYMSVYLNESYYKELKEYWLSDEFTWVIFDLLKRGKLATTLQIFIEAVLSTAAIRAFPFYYYVGLASYQSLGWFPPAPMISAFYGFQNLVYLYPKKVRKYVGDMYAVEKMLKQKIEPWVEQTLSRFNSEEIEASALASIKQTLFTSKFNAEMKRLNDIVAQQKGRFYLKNEKGPMAHIASRGFIGGFFGYTCLAPLVSMIIDSPIAVQTTCIMVSTLAFMEMLRRVDQETLDYREIKIILESELKLQAPAQQEETTSLPIKAASSVLIAGNGISTAMSTMGTLKRIPGNQSPWLHALVGMVCIDNMIVIMEYNASDMFSTVNSMAKSILETARSAWGTASNFFKSKPKANQADDEKKTSWLCFGRR